MSLAGDAVCYEMLNQSYLQMPIDTPSSRSRRLAVAGKYSKFGIGRPKPAVHAVTDFES